MKYTSNAIPFQVRQPFEINTVPGA